MRIVIEQHAERSRAGLVTRIEITTEDSNSTLVEKTNDENETKALDSNIITDTVSKAPQTQPSLDLDNIVNALTKLMNTNSVQHNAVPCSNTCAKLSGQPIAVPCANTCTELSGQPNAVSCSNTCAEFPPKDQPEFKSIKEPEHVVTKKPISTDSEMKNIISNMTPITLPSSLASTSILDDSCAEFPPKTEP